MSTLKTKLLYEGAKLPKRGTPLSAGLDVYSTIDVTIPPCTQNYFSKNVDIGRAIVPLGIAIELPEGYEVQLRPRSGLAFKEGVDGFTGTIDADYRNEVKMLLYNTTSLPINIKAGDRVGQMVIHRIGMWEAEEVKELSETERVGGFGSTGK